MDVQTDTFQRRTVGRGITEGTFEDYVRWVRRFTEWAESVGHTSIEVGTLIEFDEALMDPPAAGLEGRESPYAYRTRAKALSGVKKWAEVVEGSSIDMDVDDIVKGEPADFDPFIYSGEAIEEIHAEPCHVVGCMAARRLGYDAIMRAAEVTRVRPDDIDFEEQTVYVRAVKGSQNRHIEVNDATWRLVTDQYDRVQERFDNPSRLFYDSTDQSGWSPNGWSEHFRRNHAVDVAGEDTGFHSFARHSPITRRLQQGEPFGQVYLRARHSNVSMTARYSNVAGVGEADDELFQL